MVTRTETADIVIVGCGPGGAVLAYLLARSGVDVTLIERAATFEREYRGFGWNPGVIRLFDEMDLLEDVLELAHETVTEGTVSLYGERISVLDFDLLDTDYPYALLMEQPALLECLVNHARQYDGFSFYPATTVTDLLTDESDAVHGVIARNREADTVISFRTRAAVGADGRYSSVRTRANIDPGLFESPIDLVWFKLPQGTVDATTQGRIDRDGILVYFGLGAGDLQVGYPVRSGEWASIRKAGFDEFRIRVAAVDSELAVTMDAYLDGFRDTTLLDVSPGVANAWTRDGVLLIGDAAHTASPIGAQGNPLAVEDAVVAHSLLSEALADMEGTLSNETLRSFETQRRPTVERVIALQRRAAANIGFWLDYGQYIPPKLVRAATTTFGWAVPRTRPIQNLVSSFALGDQSVSVARSPFLD